MKIGGSSLDQNHHNRDDKTHTHFVLTKGTMVGHYRIVEKIGAGGMGEVFLADDTKLNRQVALKFLPDHMVANEDAKSRFTREAQAAAGLKHPNIVTIHEVAEFKGRPFFAMECCEGETLRETIKEQKLTIDQIIDLVMQICDGLQEAHESGIVHRDIKPSNIILDKRGRPKLVDFGLATIAGTDKLTKTGSTLGTIGYMSPEQIQIKDIDHRSDLFSLGVVLYEMLTGRLPFKGDNEASTMNAVLNETAEPLSRYKSGVSGEFQRIVSKLLEKDPAIRYQSAAEIGADLRRLSCSGETGTVEKTAFKFSIWLPLTASLILLTVVLIIIFMNPASRKSDQGDGARIMLAVLPFENLGNAEDEYFADGITDEIISRLAALHGLGVISRTSTLQYKGTTKNLREIGAELGVDYILEGTIRWDKSGNEGRVRINPQLIHVDDDVHLWTNRYDAVIDDIFAVQSSIAEEVVLALDITLVESERQALAAQPTDNAKAYDYYLRAIEYLYMSPAEENLNNAVAMFLDGIELDSEFAMAYLWLSFTHGQLYLFGHDHTEQRVNLSKQAIDRALEISPDLPGAHGALGWFYYQCYRDFDRAREEFILQRNQRPSDASAYMGIAVADRILGRWESSAENWRKAIELDPLFARVYFEYGFTLYWMRHYQEAEKAFDRAIRLKQGWHSCYVRKSWLYVLRNGDIDAARRILREALQEHDRWPWLTIHEIRLNILSHEYDKALSLLSEPGDVIEHATDSADYYNLRGDILRHAGQLSQMTACYDSARIILERQLQSEPENQDYHASLGWSYAGLGRKQNAISECNRAAELMPLSRSAIDGVEIMISLANIYTMIGEYDLAIDQLEHLMAVPSEISVPYLKMWPEFTPLRDHPRFEELLKKYGDGDEI